MDFAGAVRRKRTYQFRMPLALNYSCCNNTYMPYSYFVGIAATYEDIFWHFMSNNWNKTEMLGIPGALMNGQELSSIR